MRRLKFRLSNLPKICYGIKEGLLNFLRCHTGLCDLKDQEYCQLKHFSKKEGYKSNGTVVGELSKYMYFKLLSRNRHHLVVRGHFLM